MESKPAGSSTSSSTALPSTPGSAVVEKEIERIDQIETINTNECAPVRTNYYEKNGLRTYGDNEDHDHELPMTFSRFMSLFSMALLFSGSQIPLYLLGSAQGYILSDIGGSDRFAWFILGNLLALAAVCPFVGSLSDLLGRRWVALIGAGLLVIGMIVASTATTMNNLIAGMVISGGGAGINELTAIAVSSEIAPTAQRGKYIALLLLIIVPYIPSVFWAQLVASKSQGAWRYLSVWSGGWAFLGMVLTFIFYHPPPRVNSLGLSKRAIMAQIDWVGGLLSIGGILLFVIGLVWGGNQYAWSEPHVVVTLTLGSVMTVAFCAWEVWGAPYPMFPKRLHTVPRTLVLTLLITFISGSSFFATLIFWPNESLNVYGYDPVTTGLHGLPIPISIMTGAMVVLALLSKFRGHNRALLIASSCMMTAGTGALAVLDRSNFQISYCLLVLAGLGIGGIVVPASVMATIICPDDLIATVAALTLSIRIIGGAIGYATYFNVLYLKLKPLMISAVMEASMKADIHNITIIEGIIGLLSASSNEEILTLVGGNQTKLDIMVAAGQGAFSEAYKWVYYASIPFGIVAIVAAVFLEDMSPYMDDHVAVVYR